MVAIERSQIQAMFSSKSANEAGRCVYVDSKWTGVSRAVPWGGEEVPTSLSR